MLRAELCVRAFRISGFGPSSSSDQSTFLTHSFMFPNSHRSSLQLFTLSTPTRCNKSPFISCKNHSHGSFHPKPHHHQPDDGYLEASLLISETVRHHHLRKQGFRGEVKEFSGQLVPVSAQVKDLRNNVNSIGLSILRRFRHPTIFLKISCEGDFLLPIVVGEFAVEKLIDSLSEDDHGDYSNEFQFVRNLVAGLGNEVKDLNLKMIKLRARSLILGATSHPGLASISIRFQRTIQKVFKAKCKVCVLLKAHKPIEYTCRTGGGTGTLSRHLKSRHRIGPDGTQSSGSVQTQLHGYPSMMPGGGTFLIYNRDRMIDEFSKYIIGDELSFSHSESEHVERFNKLALNPQYARIPRNTLKRHTIKSFKEYRKLLVTYFRIFDGRVSLTSDTWTSINDEPFMCVTAHWIDMDYLLQKRIIAFEVIPEKHGGYNIKDRLINVLKRYNLIDKVFSVSLDNATANTKAISYLKDDSAFKVILDGEFVHVRCCAQILNLAAQEGIEHLRPLLDPIRTIIKFLRRGEVKRRYAKLCDEHELRRKQWSLDTPTRWNSTCKLLEDALRYREVITPLYNSLMVNPDDLIVDQHWHMARLVYDVLNAFDLATKTFSYVYEPNIHLVIVQCVQVVHQITLNENIDCAQTVQLSDVLASMKKKWLSYFTKFPYIYGIAAMLDPGVKLDGLQQLLDYYYECLCITFDVKTYVIECKHLLERLHDQYSAIYNPDYVPSSSSSSKSRFNPIITQILKKQKSTSTCEGVDEYLSLQFETENDFHILKWWRNKEGDFPMLARIAKDILAIPASTVASESAFSAGRRVLDEKRSRLSPESIEMCICKKDWDLTERRTQGLLDEAKEVDENPWMTIDTNSSASSASGNLQYDDELEV